MGTYPFFNLRAVVQIHMRPCHARIYVCIIPYVHATEPMPGLRQLFYLYKQLRDLGRICAPCS
jgi:hypothetical protein